MNPVSFAPSTQDPGPSNRPALSPRRRRSEIAATFLDEAYTEDRPLRISHNHRRPSSATTPNRSRRSSSVGSSARLLESFDMEQLRSTQQALTSAAQAALERQKAALLYKIDEALRFEAFHKIDQQEQQQSGRGGGRRGSPPLPLGSSRRGRSPNTGGSRPTSASRVRKQSADDDDDDDGDQLGEQGEEAVQHLRVMSKGMVQYRLRLTVDQQREEAESHHHTPSEVLARAEMQEHLRAETFEQLLESSKRKQDDAAARRSFTGALNSKQYVMLWQTLLLAVHLMRKLDRERRVHAALIKMTHVIVPLVRWRRVRRERRKIKNEVLEHTEDVPRLDAETLHKDALLKNFGLDFLRNIVQFARLEVFLEDDNLCFFREPGRECFVLVKGQVKVLISGPAGPICVATLPAPFTLGAIGAVTGSRRNARLQCKTDCLIYVFDNSVFRKRAPPRQVMLGAMAEARRQHLHNMKSLYAASTNPNALARFYSLEHIDNAPESQLLMGEISKSISSTMRKPGEYIIRAGERSNCVFLMFEGEVDICAPDEERGRVPHQTLVQRAMSMLDIMGPATIRDQRKKAAREVEEMGGDADDVETKYVTQKQRLQATAIVRPANYVSPELEEENDDESLAAAAAGGQRSHGNSSFASSHQYQQHQHQQQQQPPPPHRHQIICTLKARAAGAKYMLGGPRFFLLDLYDMHVVVRESVDLFELKREDFMKIMMQSPAAVVDTRSLCMKLISRHLEPPREQDVAATIFAEYPNVRYGLRKEHQLRDLLVKRPVVIPAGTMLYFDASEKHQDIFFVMRGHISHQQKKFSSAARSAVVARFEGEAVAAADGGKKRRTSPNTGKKIRGADGNAAAPGDSNRQIMQQNDESFVFPLLSQAFFSNNSYQQTVTKRIEGFRVDRAELLKWITVILGHDPLRWKSFRAAIVKPYGHEDRAPLFHAVNTQEQTREAFVRWNVLNAKKIQPKEGGPILLDDFEFALPSPPKQKQQQQQENNNTTVSVSRPHPPSSSSAIDGSAGRGQSSSSYSFRRRSTTATAPSSARGATPNPAAASAAVSAVPSSYSARTPRRPTSSSGSRSAAALGHILDARKTTAVTSAAAAVTSTPRRPSSAAASANRSRRDGAAGDDDGDDDENAGSKKTVVRSRGNSMMLFGANAVQPRYMTKGTFAYPGPNQQQQQQKDGAATAGSSSYCEGFNAFLKNRLLQQKGAANKK